MDGEELDQVGPPGASVIVGDRFTDAVRFAVELHRQQMRKGSGVPYLSHLLGVCSLVLEAGGDEDCAVAALLHDAAEDQGGMATLVLIRERFGDRVAEIVDGCSDTFDVPKPPAIERKRLYVAHLEDPATSQDVLLVSAADKLHNLRAILADFRTVGDDLWSRFRLSPTEQLWYYSSLADLYGRRLPGHLSRELHLCVEQFKAIVGDVADTETDDTSEVVAAVEAYSAEEFDESERAVGPLLVSLPGSTPLVGTSATGRQLCLGDFWEWAYSDVLANAGRGCLGEYLVASALGIDVPRVEWDAVDLRFKHDGVTIGVEVKTSSRLQSWPLESNHHRSQPTFGFAPARPWDAVTGVIADVQRRSADVYVFCHYRGAGRIVEDQTERRLAVLDVSHWDFYVARTERLAQKVDRPALSGGVARPRKAIPLEILKQHCDGKTVAHTGYGGLCHTVVTVATEGSDDRA